MAKIKYKTVEDFKLGEFGPEPTPLLWTTTERNQFITKWLDTLLTGEYPLGRKWAHWSTISGYNPVGVFLDLFPVGDWMPLTNQSTADRPRRYHIGFDYTDFVTVPKFVLVATGLDQDTFRKLFTMFAEPIEVFTTNYMTIEQYVNRVRKMKFGPINRDVEEVEQTSEQVPTPVVSRWKRPKVEKRTSTEPWDPDKDFY